MMKNPKTRGRLFFGFNKKLKENQWKKFHTHSPLPQTEKNAT
jgi:hypothetical protein